MSFHPRMWLNPVLPPLRRWECAVIDGWLREAGAETRGIVESQLALVDLAQRFIGGREVNLYSLRHGKSPAWRALKHPGREWQVAEVRARVAGTPVKAQIWAVHGHVFSIHFDRVPRNWFRRPEVEITEVRKPPFAANKSARRLRAALPADYVEMAEGPEAARPPEHEFGLIAPDEVYLVTLEEGQYWALAERPDVGMLGVRLEQEGGPVYFLFYDGRPPRPLPGSFAEAAEQARGME